LQAAAQTPMDRHSRALKHLGRLGLRPPLGPHPVGRLALPSGRRSMAARIRRLSGVRPVSLLAQAGIDSSRSCRASGCSSKRRARSLSSQRLCWPARAKNCRAGPAERLAQPLGHGPDGRSAATAGSIIPPPVVNPQRLALQAHHERMVSAGTGQYQCLSRASIGARWVRGARPGLPTCPAGVD
jgi:hypothetical protein